MTATTEKRWLYPRILRYVRETPWAIMPEVLAVIVEMLHFRAGGGRLTAEEVRARLDAQAPANDVRGRAGSGVAIIPLHGVMVHRADLFDEISGATSVERFRERLAEAAADDQVGTILLHVDSPGGAVDLVPEAADDVFAARETKRVIAVADTLAASAAYWVAASADELVVTPSGEIGSIGVFAAHTDVSRALDAAGITKTLISAGRFKTEGNPFEPLSDEARAAIKARVDDYYGMFVEAVGRGRGVAGERVRAGFGEGRAVGAREAVDQGMADRVATFDQVLRELRSGGGPGARRAASASRHRHDFSFTG